MWEVNKEDVISTFGKEFDMKKIIITLSAICLVFLGTISSVFAVVPGEDATPNIEAENDLLLEECLEESAADLIKQAADYELLWGAGDKDENNPGTHGFIAKQALTILEKNNSTLDTFFTTTRKKNIIKGSYLPDIDSQSMLWKDHFYCADGNGLSGYPTSAYDQFRAHYNGAVANYNNGNITAAMQRLGKALHYISDINQPHHSAGVSAAIPGGRHTAYEDWVEARYNNYKVSSLTTSKLSAYNSKSLLTIANGSAEFSRGYISQAKSGNTTDWEEVTNKTLKRAQHDAAKVVYKFAKEVGII